MVAQLRPGHYKGEDLNIVSAFEALGQKIAGNLDEEDFKGIVRQCLPRSRRMRRNVHC